MCCHVIYVLFVPFMLRIFSTIPSNLMDCDNDDCNTDKRYGMHENYDYYLACKMRSRNQGLFTADQVIIL